MSETTAAQREVMRLEVQLEESTQRRQASRDRLAAAERQLEIDDQQVQIDAQKLETARAEARLEELRRSANVPAPEAVRGSSGRGRRRYVLGPQRRSTNTLGMSGRGTFGGIARARSRRHAYNSTADGVFAFIDRPEDAEEIFERALRDVGADNATIVLITTNGYEFPVSVQPAAGNASEDVQQHLN